MFFDKGVLKNLAKLVRKHLCWSLFSIKLQACIFIEKRTQAFSCEYCEIFKKIFFIEHVLCSLYFSAILFDDRNLWRSLGPKLIFFIFLFAIALFSFVTLVLEPEFDFILYLFLYQNI